MQFDSSARRKLTSGTPLSRAGGRSTLPSASQPVALLGLGFIGTSLGLALRRGGVAVRGYDRGRRSGAAARRRGAVSVLAPTAAEAVRGARLVVLCVPPRAVAPVLRAARPCLDRLAVVTDTVSVKASVLGEVRRHLPRSGRFVGGHPMAGGERSGPRAGRADLFRDRLVVLTPDRGTAPPALRVVRRMWQAVGARVLLMSAARHDAVAAVTSHQPHVAAFALAAALVDPHVARMAAGSFLDATRVAVADARLWVEILLANRAAVRQAVRAQRRREDAVMAALGRGAVGDLVRRLEAAARLRRRAGGSG